MRMCCKQLQLFPEPPSLEQMLPKLCHRLFALVEAAASYKQQGSLRLRWAASVVASRAFDSSEAGVILAPFADEASRQ